MSTAASTSADACLWLRHGRLLDLDSGEESDGDVLIADGAITALGPDLSPDRPHEEIDMAGRYVLPGLFDLHTHVFAGVGDSVDADAVCLARGAVTVVDAGSAGAATIDAFARIARAYRTEALAWLNLSTIGLVDSRVGELIPGPYLDAEAVVTAARRHTGFVVGIKARLSTYAAGGGAVRVLRVLREVADELALPVMVHVGDTTEPLEEIATHLRAGDVVTHALTGRKHGILDGGGRLRSGVREARAAGVLFDAGCGGNHLSFPVLAAAAEQGFLPDTLSTDVTTHTARDPAFGLALLGSYLLAHGVPLRETLARMVVAPAAVVGRTRPAALAPGQPADLTVMALEHRPVTLCDVDGRELKATESLVAAGTVRAGTYRKTDMENAGYD
jgi:dihydroorotase